MLVRWRSRLNKKKKAISCENCFAVKLTFENIDWWFIFEIRFSPSGFEFKRIWQGIIKGLNKTFTQTIRAFKVKLQCSPSSLPMDIKLSSSFLSWASRYHSVVEMSWRSVCSAMLCESFCIRYKFEIAANTNSDIENTFEWESFTRLLSTKLLWFIAWGIYWRGKVFAVGQIHEAWQSLKQLVHS